MTSLWDIATAQAWSGFVIFVRVAAMTSLFPAFGEQGVPVRIKLAVAISFTLLVVPLVDMPQDQLSLVTSVPLIGGEAVKGLFWGILVRLMVHGLEMAGAMAAQTTSLSQIFAAAGGDPQPVLGAIIVRAGLALACILGLPVRLVEYILLGYELTPVGQLLSPENVIEVGVSTVSSVFAMAFVLAAPFVISSLIYNVALGFINKAMPQLMVSFVGAPAITAGSILLMMLAAPMLLDVWMTRFSFLLSGANW